MSLHIFDISSKEDQSKSINDALQHLYFGVVGGTVQRQSIVDALFEERKDVTVEYEKGFRVTNVIINPKRSAYDVGSLLIIQS